ncbi:MAG: 2-C-methyl-D-erythritol 4-phosphate cytidylyltransferase [Gammaproteobacteria bacterium]|jgi:2-C-methyl-D-erythritol 4-phosphate cytidylyltransferase
MSKSAVWAVVPAAGKGSRMGSDIPKQYLSLAGKPVLEHTLGVLTGHPRIGAVVLVVSGDDSRWPAITAQFDHRLIVVTGGSERCHSVLAGLQCLRDRADDRDWVLVHDAARPCLRSEDIDHMLNNLSDSECGGILAAPVRDTLKRCTTNGEIEQTVDRTRLWHALTPQMFRLGGLCTAIQTALENGLVVTDEAQAIEAAGGRPTIVEGHADNIKITHPEDLALAEMYLQIQGRS